MSKLALIGGPQALAAAVVVGVLAVVGAVVAITRPDGASEKAPEAAALVAPLSGTSASEGAAVGSTAAVTEAATKPLEGESAVTVAATPDPAFDVVRVDAEGNATIAGRAVPGAQVALLLDGAEVAEAKADGSGAFALLVTLPPSETPRALSLRAMGADGVARVSVEDAIVAPFAGPTVAAVSGAAGDATGDATGAAAAAAAEVGCGAADPSARRVVLNAAHCTWEMLDITLARKHESVSASTDGCGSVGRPGDDSGGRQRCRADQVQSSISEWNKQCRNRKWRRCRS